MKRFRVLSIIIIGSTIFCSRVIDTNHIMSAAAIINKELATSTKVVNKESIKLYNVKRIIDGDTILINYGNKDEKIRLIGVNTPESVDPRKKVECFGKEASLYTKNLLENKKVRIEFDESQGRRDKYKRLLAYVFRDDNLFVNKAIIENGYGYEYTYIHSYKYQDNFKKMQWNASSQKKGLWADGACSNIN